MAFVPLLSVVPIHPLDRSEVQQKTTKRIRILEENLEDVRRGIQQKFLVT